MEYYGSNDWRNYLHRQNDLAHFGIPRRSGRFPWGSGEDPYHHGADAPGSKKRRKLESRAYSENMKSLKAKRKAAISKARASKAQMRIAKRDLKNASNVEGLSPDMVRLVRKEAKERLKALKADNKASLIEARSIAAEIKRQKANEKLRKESERNSSMNKEAFNDYSNTLKRGEAISKSVLNDPNKKLSKEEVWDLEDYADQLFYDNTSGPSENWSSKKAEDEYYKLRKIIAEYD